MKPWIFSTALACLLVTVYCQDEPNATLDAGTDCIRQATPRPTLGRSRLSGFSRGGNSISICIIGGIDLVFVLDVSESITEDRFQIIRDFAGNTSTLLDIGTLTSLVGVILFDRNPNIYFPVTQYTDDSTLLPALNPGLPYRNGQGTDTAAALQLLQMQGQSGGDLQLRDGFVHIAMIVTDGQSTDRNATINAARDLHAADIYEQVYAIGVGEADITELNAIASDPDSDFVFNTDSFDSAGIQAILENVTEQLCSSNITNVTITNIQSNTGMMMGDPHFRVPLLSDDTLCYSIQGYPGLIFNLIYNEDFVINALFINSIDDDEKEATWIGKLAVIPRHANKSEAVIFDSINQEVLLVDQGSFKASVINTILYDENGKLSVKFTRGLAKQAGNPTVHVKYDKPLASFDVTFFSNHLDVNWHLKYDSVPKIHGLMGQFMVKGVAIDPIKKILTYPDGHDPVAVEMDDVMTGTKCWKAMNPGHQGEGLIKGSILDYMVSSLLEDNFKLKSF